MKGSAPLMASVLAASTVAFSSSSASPYDSSCGSNSNQGWSSAAKSGSASQKFAPRFDGLRFIETLVTAHR